jgi:hypothetical protein
MSDTQEESGPPVTGRDTTDVVTLVPPPLTLEQADKLAKAIAALEELIDSLGTVGGALAKYVLGKVLEGLKAMGPVPPLVPSGTQEPTAPPETTP